MVFVKKSTAVKAAVGAVIAAKATLDSVIAIKAAKFKAPPKPPVALPEETVDPQRALEHLSQAIRIPTISYWESSEVDWSSFEAFHQFLADSYPLVRETLTREKISSASLLYCWKGTNPALDPIALLSHMDVVPVSPGTEQDWTHPPFAGVNDGEYLWGRGAMDMKHHLVAVMEAVETLLQEGFRPERDVYLCFGHNEEIVGAPDNGAKAMAETLKARGVRLESVLDEGGTILPVDALGIHKKFATVGVTEKGLADIKITVRAKGGHSSAPPRHSALGKLAKIITNVEKHPFHATILPPVREMVETAGSHMPYYIRLILGNLWFFEPILKKVMTGFDATASVLRSTIAVTQAEGSPATNILPQKASVNVNCRILPGESVESVKRHFEALIHDKDVELEVVKSKEPSPISPTSSRAYQMIDTLCRGMDGEVVTVPLLVMGGTDAYNYEQICSNVYRFSPFVTQPELLHCTHATNERLPVAAMEGAVVFFKRYIRAMSRA